MAKPGLCRLSCLRRVDVYSESRFSERVQEGNIVCLFTLEYWIYHGSGFVRIDFLVKRGQYDEYQSWISDTPNFTVAELSVSGLLLHEVLVLKYRNFLFFILRSYHCDQSNYSASITMSPTLSRKFPNLSNQPLKPNKT